jgi:hypothetical protein
MINSTASFLTGFFHRNKLRVILSLFGIGTMAMCGSAIYPDAAARRQFTVCLSYETAPSDCTNSLHVSVLRSADPLHFTDDYLDPGNSHFKIRIPPNEKMTTYMSPSFSQVYFSFSQENFSQLYSRYARTGVVGSGFGYPIYRTEGTLIAIKESAPGEEGSDFLVPASGDKSIFIECIKPWRSATGYLVTNVGCQVYTQLRPNVFVQYGIKRQYLQDWHSINDDVLRNARALVQIENQPNPAQNL